MDMHYSIDSAQDVAAGGECSRRCQDRTRSHDGLIRASKSWQTSITGTLRQSGEGGGDLRVSDNGFIRMLNAYRRSGGLGRHGAVLRRAKMRSGHAASSLGELLQCGQLVQFEWNDDVWLPFFQFNMGDMKLREGPRQVITELWPVFDGASMADWFSAPNSWLGDRHPVDLLDDDLESVVQAARADRFIAVG